MKICPDCGEPLKRINDTLYQCQNTGLYYPTKYGRLGWPLTNPPKKEQLLPTTPQGAPTIDLWRMFLKEWGLTNDQYMKLPKTLKDFYRYHYNMWLKQKEKEAEQMQKETAIAKIIS